ncbi:MAG: alanine racemase [Planctomycetales bacterium]|nr:alanine racemase [Planctomycetales bacterium]
MDFAKYRLSSTEHVLTPCLLGYPDIIKHNIQEAIRIARSAQRLRPHVKTHKSSRIIGLMKDLGVTKHKCATLAEAHMLALAKASDVLIAYPLVGPATDHAVRLIESFPDTKFYLVVDNTTTAKVLSQAMNERLPKTIEVLIDVDTGMHRTGAPVTQVAELLDLLTHLQGLVPSGFHIYDGQNHQPSLEERESAVGKILADLRPLADQFKASCADNCLMVCGGTPTFPVFAQVCDELSDCTIELSPGTFVLNDFNYGRDYRDMDCFQPAALMLSRVISIGSNQHYTIDLGYKAVASDPPARSRCHFVNIHAEEVQHSEEHLVIRVLDNTVLELGDLVYVQPAHICPTVALHCEMQIVIDGQVNESWPIDARDRFYR